MCSRLPRLFTLFIQLLLTHDMTRYNINKAMQKRVSVCACVCVRVFESFEARAKLAQQWLVCAPLLEPINKELMLLVII